MDGYNVTNGFDILGPNHANYPNPGPGAYMNWFDMWNNYAANSPNINMFSSSGEVQFSEWSQQMISTMYQNWYNSAPEQMKRAMDAGINPFVAASGIAGSDVGSVASAPPQTPNRGVEGINAASGIGNMLANNFSSFAGGFSMLSKLRPEIEKIGAETTGIFESLGFSQLQSKALSVSLKYLDEKEQIGVWQALATFDKTQAEYLNLLGQHRNILAQYDEIIAHKDLLIAQEGEVHAQKLVDDAMKRKLDTEASWQETENKFFTDHGYKLGTPVYESMRDIMVSNGTFDFDTFGDTIAGYNGKVTTAVEDAKAAASWDYRPSNIAEAAAYAGQHLGESLRSIILSSNGSSSWLEFASKLRTNAAAQKEFNQAYNDAREDLYETYLSKKRYYRNIKRGGNSQEVARAQNAMNTAKQEYESFTKEKFGMQLLSQQFQNATQAQ